MVATCYIGKARKRTWDLLFLGGTTSEQFDALADRLGFHSDTAKSILARAHNIQQIKESRGKRIERHRMESVAINRIDPDEERELTCPWCPKSREDQKIIEDLEPPPGAAGA